MTHAEEDSHPHEPVGREKLAIGLPRFALVSILFELPTDYGSRHPLNHASASRAISTAPTSTSRWTKPFEIRASVGRLGSRQIMSLSLSLRPKQLTIAP